MSGGSQARKTRCSDRFVKYPYPKSLITNYQKEYYEKKGKGLTVPSKEAFNIEKEHKIINPHKMEFATTNKSSFQPFVVEPAKKVDRKVKQNDAPCQQKSSYQAEFPNWQNGKNDIYHEKSP